MITARCLMIPRACSSLNGPTVDAAIARIAAGKSSVYCSDGQPAFGLPSGIAQRDAWNETALLFNDHCHDHCKHNSTRKSSAILEMLSITSNTSRHINTSDADVLLRVSERCCLARWQQGKMLPGSSRVVWGVSSISVIMR